MPSAHTGRTQRPDPNTPHMQPITARMLRHPDADPSSQAGLPDGTRARTLTDILRPTAARHADNAFPGATLGEGCSVGARSVVMRGESLPDGTRWHGAPVVPA
jgi:hypothetical protein